MSKKQLFIFFLLTTATAYLAIAENDLTTAKNIVIGCFLTPRLGDPSYDPSPCIQKLFTGPDQTVLAAFANNLTDQIRSFQNHTVTVIQESLNQTLNPVKHDEVSQVLGLLTLLQDDNSINRYGYLQSIFTPEQVLQIDVDGLNRGIAAQKASLEQIITEFITQSGAKLIIPGQSEV